MSDENNDIPPVDDRDDINLAPINDNDPKTVSPFLIIFGITGLVGLVIAIMLFLGEASPPADGDTVQAVPTTPAPPRPLNDWRAEDFALQNLDGELVSLSDFSGRVVFVNMWHTACEPCVREMPAFQQFMSEQGENGAMILAVNQLGQTPNEIRPFLDNIGVSNITVLIDPDFILRDKFPYNFFPTTYVIDKEGMVRFFKVGELDIAQMRQWAEQLEG
ncbi:MAG: TlpA disulfide reductase family protein [Phototrophicales bacterium]|nr:TlpA disulfide reductase family protein [Phototrophicales bacterium]